MKKKIIALLLAGAVALSLCSCGDAGQEPGSDPPDKAQESVSAPTATEPTVSTEPTVEPSPSSPEPAPVETLEESGTIGDYSVEIHDCELSQDYSGAAAAVVSYTFTNNGAETVSGMSALSDRAYQNGVQLDTAVITGQNIVEDQMKDIKTGASIELKAAFLLTSDTAPVEFEISKLMDLSGEKLGKTFQLAEGGETVLSVAPSGDVSGELGGYTVSVVSHKLSKDYQDAPAIVVSLGFTNNTREAKSFLGSAVCKAFQDGVELETAIMTGEDAGTGESQMRNVKPGAGTEVTVAYLLTSDTSPVELEIEEFMSFSGAKIETTLDIANG